ncbi:MAG: hypothetical protein ACOCUP_01940 [bacterium]
MVSKRAKYLMNNYLDGKLTEEEILELKEYLKDPEYKNYFMDLRRADMTINLGMMKKLFEEDLEWGSSEFSDEEIEEDIRKYGGKPKEGDKSREFVRVLSRAHQARQARQVRKKFIKESIIATLAAAAMVTVVLILWSKLGGSSGEKLYARYHEKYEYELFRSDRTMDKDYLHAVENYNEDDYQASIRISQQIISENPAHIEARFLYALSLQESGIIDEAMEQHHILLAEAENKNERIYPLSAWYLGLCYVLKEEPLQALKYLEIARDNAGLFLDRDEVGELMRKVGEIGSHF